MLGHSLRDLTLARGACAESIKFLHFASKRPLRKANRLSHVKQPNLRLQAEPSRLTPR